MPTVTKVPCSASASFRNAEKQTQITLSGLKTDLTHAQLIAMRQAFNAIRRTDRPLSGGRYTIREELKEA